MCLASTSGSVPSGTKMRSGHATFFLVASTSTPIEGKSAESNGRTDAAASASAHAPMIRSSELASSLASGSIAEESSSVLRT